MNENWGTSQTLGVVGALDSRVSASATAVATQKELKADAPGNAFYKIITVRPSAVVKDLQGTLEGTQQMVQIDLRGLLTQHFFDVLRLVWPSKTSSATMGVTEKKLEEVVNELIRLVVAPEDDNFPRPSDYSFTAAIQTACRAYTLVQLEDCSSFHRIPQPIVSTDDTAGLRLSWSLRGRRVRANFGGAKNLRSYLYFEFQQDHGVEGLDGERLAQRLRWLTSPE